MTQPQTITRDNILREAAEGRTKDDLQKMFVPFKHGQPLKRSHVERFDKLFAALREGLFFHEQENGEFVTIKGRHAVRPVMPSKEASEPQV